MTEEDLEEFREIVDREGFFYGLLEYSSFNHIKDEEFHRRRDNLLKAISELESYLGV